MDDTILKNMLEAGVHFGHRTNRWNPKMERFIFGEKNGIHIIDLEKTFECLNRAREFLKEIARSGETVLFVGTKKQAQDIIKEEVSRCEMPYVKDRWLGGTLTNFQTIKKSIKYLKELQALKESEGFSNLSKKEQAHILKEIERLNKKFEGINQMAKLPAALYLIDPQREDTAVREANRLSIPIVALIDTNGNPDLINYPIPGNDDALRSIRLITSLICESVLEGRKEFIGERPKEEVAVGEEKEEVGIVKPVEEIEVLEEVKQKEARRKPALRKRPVRPRVETS